MTNGNPGNVTPSGAATSVVPGAPLEPNRRATLPNVGSRVRLAAFGAGSGPSVAQPRSPARRRVVRVRICHESEPRSGRARFSQKWPELAAIELKSTAQQGSVLVRVSAIGAGVGNDQPDAHERRLPAALGGDPASETRLAVKRTERLVDIHELGLEFDHQDVGRAFVACQLVDDAALFIDRERHLRHGDPAGVGQDERGNPLGKERMTPTQQPVEITPASARRHLHANVHGSGDSPDGLNR
jgi:hypothetical protein